MGPQKTDDIQHSFGDCDGLRHTAFILTLLATLGIGLIDAQTITVRNNQPFPVRMPVRIHGLATNDGPWRLSNGQPAQNLGEGVVFIADVPGSSTQQFALTPGAAPETPPVFKLEANDPGVGMSYSGRKLGRLEWGLDIQPPANGAGNYADEFKPLKLHFRRADHGPVLDRWTAAATNSGLEISVELLAYANGFLDVNAHLTNLTADAKTKVYAAVVCKWEHSPSESQTISYDNRVGNFPEIGRSQFRAGHDRHWFVQHGVDWLDVKLKNGTSVAWLNDFDACGTVLDQTAGNTFHQPRYANANLSQMSKEMQSEPAGLYSITEIARPETLAFHNRLTENVLPARGEGLSFSSRLIFSQTNLNQTELDNALVSYAGYNPQTASNGNASVSFGVPYVRFGTSYFPYSTLGENFDSWKLPGMDRESFWPLAADTVLQWRLFADDIRRDLRIAKAMGFQLIRLHHLELLGGVPEKTRLEYLDFLFGQLRELKLRALIDIYASPEQLSALVGRYRGLIDGVELENEILIWGIPLDRPAEWKAEYAAVKKVAPEIPVFLTGYNDTGMFDRLQLLGVPFDRVDLHSYIDSLDFLPSARGYALALGSYATKVGKPPLVTEWNWRGLTRMPEADRAKIERSVFEGAIGTRAIPDFYEFQFNETLSPNPRIGRGNLLRHYELLNLSRRPKPEAFEFMKMIEAWSAPDDPVRLLRSSHPVVQLDQNNRAQLAFSVTNTSRRTLKIHASVEPTGGLQAHLLEDSDEVLAAGTSAKISLAVSLTNRVPGFYHVFVRLESDDAFLRYLWAEVRVPGAPVSSALDFSAPIAVAYAPQATVLEVETAYAIGQTLESASGVPIDIEQMDHLATGMTNLIFVGQPPPANAVVVISGKDSRQVEDTGMDFVLSYWKSAKDSAARKVGLARKDLPRGADATKLP